MFHRTPYNYDRDAASSASALCCDESEDMTQQQFKDEADINEITRRFGLGAEMPQGIRMPTYGDFTGLESYHDACNAIAMAGEAFDALPAEVRLRFRNDPGELVSFLSDDANRDEAVKLGLRNAAPLPDVAPVATVAAAISAAGEVRTE